jgi:hypothetical protein
MAYGQPPRGAAIIGSMFVYKIKMNPDGTIEKFKVRLVALDWQPPEVRRDLL